MKTSRSEEEKAERALKTAKFIAFVDAFMGGKTDTYIAAKISPEGKVFNKSLISLMRTGAKNLSRPAELRAIENLRIDERWFNDGDPSTPPKLDRSRVEKISKLVDTFLLYSPTLPEGSREVAITQFFAERSDPQEENQVKLSSVETPSEASFNSIFFGNKNPQECFVVTINDDICLPRLKAGAQIVFHRNSAPPTDTLVIAQRFGSPFAHIRAYKRQGGDSGPRCIKQLDGPAEDPVEDWEIIGAAIMIKHGKPRMAPNIEWDDGNPLDA